MPLHSVINGALRCQVMTKRTKQRCKNPAAYGCNACRMHGAHKSRNVLRGKNHPKFKNGDETLKARVSRSENSAMLLYLRDIGDSIGMFSGTHTRGRKPRFYKATDLTIPENFLALLLKTIKQKI
jgi:hypothetical protein